MTERPILMSAPMVLASLDGRKTNTRRVVRDQQRLAGDVTRFSDTGWTANDSAVVNLWHGFLKSRYGVPGDRLWVKETWAPCDHMTSISGSVLDDPCDIAYRADLSALILSANDAGEDVRRPANTYGWNWQRFKWKSSLFMERWMSRLTLEITSIRVERLQAITREDAIAEGLKQISKDGGQIWKYGIPDRDGLPGTDDHGWEWQDWNADPRAAFSRLWDAINGKREGCSWSDNPWVWRIEFRRTVSP